MNVIAFRRCREPGGWSPAERETLLAAFDVTHGGWTWETSTTEDGDPQLYLLGPQPDQACALCVSKTGGRYVLEDGAGRLLVAHRDLDVVATHAANSLRGPRSWLIARIVVVWCTVRHVFHERVEPVLVEGEELLVHIAPQLAAFA